MELKGDILEYFDIMKDSCVQPHVLVHGCNCMGRFNSGLAKQIRQKYPEVYKSYMMYVKNNDPRYLLGSADSVKVGETGVIVNGFTQQFYGTDPNRTYVNYRAIGKVLHTVSKEYPDRAIIMPRIGAGLGNGDWREIKGIIHGSMEKHFFIVFGL